jgi:hypothetical protein
MLPECIHVTRQETDVVSLEHELHLHFASKLMPDDWYLIDRITTGKVSHITADSKSMYCRKFKNLHKTQHLLLPSDNRKPVTNLSSMLLEATLLGPE